MGRLGCAVFFSVMAVIAIFRMFGVELRGFLTFLFIILMIKALSGSK